MYGTRDTTVFIILCSAVFEEVFSIDAIGVFFVFFCFFVLFFFFVLTYPTHVLGRINIPTVHVIDRTHTYKIWIHFHSKHVLHGFKTCFAWFENMFTIVSKHV